MFGIRRSFWYDTNATKYNIVKLFSHHDGYFHYWRGIYWLVIYGLDLYVDCNCIGCNNDNLINILNKKFGHYMHTSDSENIGCLIRDIKRALEDIKREVIKCDYLIIDLWNIVIYYLHGLF